MEPFKDPDHLPHIKNLRIGTRALTFWPQRFTTDPDADSLIELLRDVKEVGGRHIAIMSHLSHYRELSTKKVQDAIHRLKQVLRRRPVVWRRLHFTDTTRVHLTSMRVVSLSISSWFVRVGASR